MPKLSTTTSEEVDADEHAIDAAGEKRDPFITRVSVTIAILAVVGVTLGSLEGLETSASSSANSAALLHQDRATDYWSSYEAQNIKSMLQTLAPAREIRASAGTGAPARHGNTAPEDLATAARAQETLSEGKLRDAEKHERRHHVLTMAVTLVQVAIAIATIAIIAKSQRWPWYTSIALGIAGAAIGALAYA